MNKKPESGKKSSGSQFFFNSVFLVVFWLTLFRIFFMLHPFLFFKMYDSSAAPESGPASPHNSLMLQPALVMAASGLSLIPPSSALARPVLSSTWLSV